MHSAAGWWARVLVANRAALCLSLITVSCGKAPPVSMPPITVVAPTPVTMRATVTLAATAGSNPNEEGRPSPIVVRLYQLRAAGAFNDADFAMLNKTDQSVLGQDLIRRDEYTLIPGGRRQMEIDMPEQAATLCAVAAFQRIETAVWRACVALPVLVVDVTIDDARVSMTSKGL
jgi:type VI secretion system protein VasD